MVEPQDSTQQRRRPPIRQRLEVRGRVQGVGFRPFVYRLALELELTGLVGNNSRGAFIEVQGPPEGVAAFAGRLRSELPPLARIRDVAVRSLPPRQDDEFTIHQSEHDATQDAEITPDVATCPDCRRELFDPTDRRYRYPFINCTNCGPRYSIIRSVPYDRPGTTMARFTMCPACQAEYDDPGNRRFHAQPNACPVCGPRVWLEGTRGARGREEEDPGRVDPIRECARLIREGKIVAIKGLGGFHLACRADDDEAVGRLRERKSRESKPLALMVADLDAARAVAQIEQAAAAALTDVSRPIVLAPRLDRREAGPTDLKAGRTNLAGFGLQAGRTGPPYTVSRHVAPGTDILGIMLPYTPLHELLFAEGLGPVVMTSGNPTEEPLCCDNEEARQRLAHIADAFLLHDRDIERRVDDSVVLIAENADVPGFLSQEVGEVGTESGAREIPIRRARGFAPAPIRVPVSASKPVLAVGAELKSTICVLAGQTAIVSEHLGELINVKAYRNFVASIEQFKRLLRADPKIIACDLHPEYSSTRYAQAYAQQEGLRLVRVQHHHAHMAAAMAENDLTGPLLGISCDGTGYGTDGAIWGCEVLAGDEREYRRVGHLRYFPLLGGDAAARETWRPAAGLLFDCFGENWREVLSSFGERVSPEKAGIAHARLKAGRLPLTSSLGRLFDAVAFLVGVCEENRHEAEAAMALEAAARTREADTKGRSSEPLAYCIANRRDSADGPLEWDVRPMIQEILSGLRAGRRRSELASAFHETVAAGLAEMGLIAARKQGLERVVLSGGCFANRLLLGRLVHRLRSAGLQAYTHRLVPTGDGGVSLGQAVCGAAQMR